MKIRILIRMGLIRMTALIGMGALINKRASKEALVRKGMLIGRRTLNLIITVSTLFPSRFGFTHAHK